MHVIAVSNLRNFWKNVAHQDSEPPLKAWLAEATKATWTQSADVNIPNQWPVNVVIPCQSLSMVRQAWRVARKRNLTGRGGQSSDLEVKVLCTPGKGTRPGGRLTFSCFAKEAQGKERHNITPLRQQIAARQSPANHQKSGCPPDRNQPTYWAPFSSPRRRS